MIEDSGWWLVVYGFVWELVWVVESIWSGVFGCWLYFDMEKVTGC